jgi:hypothetical protein
MIASPVGFVIGALLFAASAVDMTEPTAQKVIRWASALRVTLLVAVVAWAIASVRGVPPLSGAPLERGSAPLVVVAAVSVGCFVAAAIAYLRLYRRRPSRLALSVVAAATLLAEAMVAVAFSRNWHASWWEWHVRGSLASRRPMIRKRCRTC